MVPQLPAELCAGKAIGVRRSGPAQSHQFRPGRRRGRDGAVSIPVVGGLGGGPWLDGGNRPRRRGDRVQRRELDDPTDTYANVAQIGLDAHHGRTRRRTSGAPDRGANRRRPRHDVATAVINGIDTHYKRTGSGPPVLMFCAGGFNATIDNWRNLGVYQRAMFDHLTADYPASSSIAENRATPEGGWNASAGRITPSKAWDMLDHLGIASAAVMGGCVGCSVALSLAVAHPSRVTRMVLYSPAGGVKYRMKQHERLTRHLGVRCRTPACRPSSNSSTPRKSRSARTRESAHGPGDSQGPGLRQYITVTIATATCCSSAG